MVKLKITPPSCNQKIDFLGSFFINVLWLNANLVQTNNENPGDYGSIECGFGTIKVVNDSFTFKLDNGSKYSSTFTGSAQKSLVAQIQKALASTQPDMFDLTRIAVMLSLNNPACATAVGNTSLYV